MTPPDRSGRIGPNAISRIAQALEDQHGTAAARRVFHAARLESYLANPPQDMVDEDEVARLHHALHRELGTEAAADVATAAGRLTGGYLLAYRIPALAKPVLSLLPPSPSARLLLNAIAKHSWTFSGSGVFTYVSGDPIRVSITNCPVCRQTRSASPVCQFYTATFETIFRALVSPHTRVVETLCQATGASSCTFEISWR